MSGPWRFCLVADVRGHGADQPAGFPGASLEPGRTTLRLLPMPWALQPALRCTLQPARLGGQQKRSVERGGGQAPLSRVRESRERPRPVRAPSVAEGGGEAGDSRARVPWR